MSIYNNLINANVTQPLLHNAKKILSDNAWFYAKVTAVALAVITAAALIYLAFTHFSKKPMPTPPDPKKPVQGPTSPRNLPGPIDPSNTDPQQLHVPKQPWRRKPSSEDLKKKRELEEQRRQQQEDEDIARAIAASLLDQDNQQQQSANPAAQTQPSDPTQQQILPSPKTKQPRVSGSPAQKTTAEPAKSSQKVKIPEAPFSTEINAFFDKVSNRIFSDYGFSAAVAFQKISQGTKDQILNLFDELIFEFERRNPSIPKIAYGNHVPEYFANVKEGNANQRKYYSLVGIRNLLKYGPQVIDDLSEKFFLGGEHNYSQQKGLNLLKHYTGIAVDLDIELPPKKIKNDQEAIEEAKKLIVIFGKKFGMQGNFTVEEVIRKYPNRKLELPHASVIHTSQTNKDRSNGAIWKRNRPGTGMCYYVNVPNFDHVIGATLCLPYRIAELVWRAKEANHGKLSKEFLDDFFNNGLSDMCLNEKFNTFIEFCEKWNKEFSPVETGEETAIRKIDNGEFGSELQQKGSGNVLKEAFSKNSLSEFISNNDNRFTSILDLSDDQWIEDNIPICFDILAEQSKGSWAEVTKEGKTEKVWKAAVLYCSDPANKDNEYFLLNETTLKLFLPEFLKGFRYLFEV